MGGKLIAVLIVGIVVVSSSALIAADLLNHDSKDISKDDTPDDSTPDDTVAKIEHTITYVLYEGTNSSDNPAKYTEGVGTKLYAATKEGCVFIGWFLEDTFENE
ncbi:MAG: InlB B-repeat-containing protein, partial [Candidatus Methanomethylophilaceae archaeon]|nr:InlB B-repeat-containing protein [Candidatus Methanomethylophilaceae archaeon]